MKIDPSTASNREMRKTRQFSAVWQVAFVPPRVSTPKTRTKLGFFSKRICPRDPPSAHTRTLARTHKRAPNGATADKGLKIAANAYQRNARFRSVRSALVLPRNGTTHLPWDNNVPKCTRRAFQTHRTRHRCKPRPFHMYWEGGWECNNLLSRGDLIHPPTPPLPLKSSLA